MSDIDLEQGSRRRRHLRRPSVGGSGGGGGDDDASCFSDAEDDTASCYSQFYSTTGESYDDYNFSCVSDREITEELEDNEEGGNGVVARRVSSVSDSDCSVEVVLVVEERSGGGVHELKKVRSANKKVVVGDRDCRICHLGLESNSHESGVPIQLGCSCKGDLAAAHKQCAETWFKIKGDKTCEICHAVARNVSGLNDAETVEQPNEVNNASTVASVSTTVPRPEGRSSWRGHRFLNFLLACMVFAFVVSWLFHFNVPSS